jgi:dTDP-glucose pyrophosphorylase
VKNVILLAAGRSSRFGRNKLEERFGGLTLPQRAAKFAIANGCEKLYLTLSRSAVKTDGVRVYHSVLEDIRALGIEPIVAFQDELQYGPGAAVSCWSQVITEPATVLFGDNLYVGQLPSAYNQVLDGDYKGAVFTTRFLEANPRNLQLAAVSYGVVVEKPHSILRGDYFCGFVRFPAGYLQRLGSLRKSERGEVEITEMINFCEEKDHWDIDRLNLIWGDITYESDVPAMRALIEGHAGE